MTDWLWSFIWGLLPWWAWLAIGLAAAIAVYRLLGWKGALAVLATTFGAAAYSRGAKRGIEIERAKQDRADQRARDVIYDNRAEMDALPDDELDRRLNRWDKS